MKRTQSKAVKRKGAVKVPKGWRKLRRGEKRPSVYRYFNYHLGFWKDGFDILVGDAVTSFDLTTATYIRRNPRAARANKGRKV